MSISTDFGWEGRGAHPPPPPIEESHPGLEHCSHLCMTIFRLQDGKEGGAWHMNGLKFL